MDHGSKKNVGMNEAAPQEMEPLWRKKVLEL
jgi:hypothetical protein